MGFIETLVAMARGELANAHKIAITVPTRGPGYNNTMVQRPVIGVGNAPQYWPNAQFIPFNSVVGGGTIAGNPPAATRTVLDWQHNMMGAPTQRGTLTPSRQLVGLADQPNFNIADRR